MILKLITKGQLLHRDDFPNRMIAGNVKIDKIEFEFDDSWNDFVKTVVFSKNGKIVPVLLNDTNICDVPPEVTIENGLVGIGVFGVKGKQKYVSEEIQIFFEKGVPTDGDLLGEYTPDIYQQILNLATEAVDTSKRVEAETKELNEQSKAVLEAETERIATEEARQENEHSRIDAESQRIEAEEERQENEHSRIDAESQRIEAEEERQQTFETLKDEAEGLNMQMSQGLLFLENETQNALDQFQADTSTALSGFDVEKRQALDNFAEQSTEALEKVQTATDRANETIDNMPNVYANALKGTASGEIISITDISPIEHNMGVKLSSKNIIPFPYETKQSLRNGITYTVNEDNSITMNGTCEGSTSTFYLTKWSITEGLLDDLFEDGETYKISINATGYAQSFILHCKEKETNKDVYYYGGATFKVDKAKYLYTHFRLQVNVGKTVDNVTIYPMVEKGTTATAYTPFVEDVSTTTLNACGKNLFNNNTDLIKVVNYISSSGVDGSRAGYDIDLPCGTYTIRASNSRTTKESYIYGGVFGADNVIKQSVQPVVGLSLRTVTFTIGYGDTLKIYAGDKNVTVSTAKTLFGYYDIQIEVGESATSYEPYIEPINHTPNADGTVEGVKSIYPNMTLYTDTSGVLVECEYNKDTNKVIENLVNAIISLGGNV